jgi:hypothetical protein
METVKLKNGSEEVEALVKVTMISLGGLFEEKPLVFYDLVMYCRDNSYEWFGHNQSICKELSLLLPDGSVHDSIKNIVLSAAVGSDLDMRLVSPVAETKEAPDAGPTV